MSDPARILVVEDRESLRRLLVVALEAENYAAHAVESAEEGIAALAKEAFALVLTDLKLPGLSGLEVVRAARAKRPPVPVVVMTAYGTVESAVEAMRLGALDFLEKPVEIEELYRRIAAVVGRAEETRQIPGGPRIVGTHPKLQAALHLVERVAPGDTTVLLLGETGTGKELFARAVHALSGRKGPFVALNCAAIPETLIENELFGHERGAFTGADRRQAGRFEAAHGGTLLLDEIGELPTSAQAKVLRVLEERVFERIGGQGAVRVDVRLVAATNRDLKEMVAEGRFRGDLYYRLDVFPIALPPLRERREDIALLARHLLRELAARAGNDPPVLDIKAIELLSRRPWPGNVRELANVLHRASILHGGSKIGVAQLEPLLEPLAESEEERIKEALVESEGGRAQAAERLGMSERTLQRRIKEFGLEGFPKYWGSS